MVIGSTTPLHIIDDLLRLGDEIVTESSFQLIEENVDVVDRLGFLRASRYFYTNDPADIDKAIELGRRAVKATTPTDPNRWNILDNLAYGLSVRFDSRQQIEDIMESISFTRQALQCPFSSDDSRVGVLVNLGARLTKYSHTAPGSDGLQEAIGVSYEIVDSLSSTSAKRSYALMNLSILIEERFERTGFRRDLDEALHLAFLSKSYHDMDKDVHAAILYNIGQLLGKRYDLTGDIHDLKECVGHLNDATKNMTRGSMRYQQFVYAKAKRYLLYAELTQVAADVHLAGFAVKEAAEFMPNGQTKYQYLKEAASLYASLSIKSLNIGDWVSFLELFVASMDAMPDSEYEERLKDETFREKSMQRLHSQLHRFQETLAIGVNAIKDPKLKNDVFNKLRPDALNIENFVQTMMEFIYPGKFNVYDFDPVAVVILSSLQEFYKQTINTSGLVQTMVNMVNECVDIRLDIRISDQDRAMTMVESVYRQASSFGLCIIRLRIRIIDLCISLDNRQESSSSTTPQNDNSDHPTPQELRRVSDRQAELFLRTRQVEYLEKAIECAEKALNHLKMDGGPDHLIASTADSLVKLFYTKYWFTGTFDSLRRCLCYSEMTLNHENANDTSHLVAYMQQRTEMMRQLALHTSLIEDFDQAQEHAIQTLSLASKNKSFSSINGWGV